MKNFFKKDSEKSFKINTLQNQEEGVLNWLEEALPEGQLLIDVYQNDEQIIIKSTLAGVSPENLFISLNRDMLTIRGRREIDKLTDKTDCLIQECYWGSFSRTIILPEEVDAKKIDASLENGVLTIILEKIYKDYKIKVKIKS